MFGVDRQGRRENTKPKTGRPQRQLAGMTELRTRRALFYREMLLREIALRESNPRASCVEILNFVENTDDPLLEAAQDPIAHINGLIFADEERPKRCTIS